MQRSPTLLPAALTLAVTMITATTVSALPSECQECHSRSFVNANFANADKMLKEADKLFAEAIEIRELAAHMRGAHEG